MQQSVIRVTCSMNVTSLTHETNILTTAVDLFVVRGQHHLCVLICTHLSRGLRQWHSVSTGYHQILDDCELIFMTALQLFLVCLWVLLKCTSSWKQFSLHPVNLFLTSLLLLDSVCRVPRLPVTEVRVGGTGFRLQTEPLFFKRTTLTSLPCFCYCTAEPCLVQATAQQLSSSPLRAYITFSQLVILS